MCILSCILYAMANAKVYNVHLLHQFCKSFNQIIEDLNPIIEFNHLAFSRYIINFE